MADIRINALATTAASTASDDYIAIDGSANGTRKLDAYSPTFGGNLTVSGTSLVNAPINVNAPALQVSSTDNDASGLYLKVRSSPGSANARNWAIWNNYNSAGNLDILRSTTNTGAPTTTAFSLDSSSNATLAGNLTVSGTGTSSFAGSLQANGGASQSVNTPALRIGNDKILVWLDSSSTTTNAGFLWYDSSNILRIGAENGTRIQVTAATTTISNNLTVSTGFILNRVNAKGIYTGTSDNCGFTWTGTNGEFSTASGSLILKSAGTTALTLDSSQNATFAGKITANGAGSTFKGTATNDSAAAGYVGEYVSSTVVQGSAVSLTTATTTGVTSISLTAGDWDIDGNVNFIPQTSTVRTRAIACIFNSVGLPAADQYSSVNYGTTDAAGNIFTVQAVKTRYSLSATTTIYLTTYADFSGGTLSAFGSIRARRVR
jgi:hypothetical protein